MAMPAARICGKTPRGKKFWVKYRFKTEQGVQNFTDAEAGPWPPRTATTTGVTCGRRSSARTTRAWRLEMQIMPFEDAADYRFNPFDITKVWPHKDYPLIPMGRMVLDRNPDNFFAQVTQVAFEVADFVPGIGPARIAWCWDGCSPTATRARYRNGPNYLQLPINKPINEVPNYNKDGPMRYHHQSGNHPVYRRTAMAARRPTPSATATRLVCGGRRDYAHGLCCTQGNNNFIQPGTLYREVMSPVDRDHLVGNIVWQLSQGVERFIQERAVKSYLSPIDPDLGVRGPKASAWTFTP